jgi:hypothetical protein
MDFGAFVCTDTLGVDDKITVLESLKFNLIFFTYGVVVTLSTTSFSVSDSGGASEGYGTGGCLFGLSGLVWRQGHGLASHGRAAEGGGWTLRRC